MRGQQNSGTGSPIMYVWYMPKTEASAHLGYRHNRNDTTAWLSDETEETKLPSMSISQKSSCEQSLASALKGAPPLFYYDSN
jgi:hypothetical protein